MLGHISLEGVAWEKALLTEVLGQETSVIPDALSENERASLDCMLNEHYGIPWCLSALELELAQEEGNDHTVKELEIFWFIMPDTVHPLRRAYAMSTWNLGRSGCLVYWILVLSVCC